MNSIAHYIKEAQSLNPDKFSIEIIEGIFREARGCVGDDGDIINEALAKIEAFVSTFIETSQKTCKNGNTFELEGFLGAIRFRYCDKCTKEGN